MSLREKVQNFNMIFHDFTQFFFKHKDKVDFKCLDHSEVLSSGFQGGLKTSAASMTSRASTASFHQKNY